LLKFWRRFLAAEGGNVAVFFALAFIPIVGSVGATVDYSRASSARTAMQAAADATALMLSKNAATLTSSELATKAQDYFNALFNRPQVTGVVVTPIYTSSGGPQIVVNASGALKTNIMGVVGISTMNIAVSSTIAWGNSRLRVALALDTTGSMASSGKIDALKTATNNLLTQLKSAAVTDGDVYVSIVPFAKDVNLNPANYNANWIDWTEWEDEPPYIKSSKPSGWDQVNAGDACPFSSSNHGFGCAPNPTSTSTTSYIPSSGTYTGYICPGTDNGSKVPGMSGSVYNGCYNSVQNSRVIDSGSGASCGMTSNCACSGNGSNKICKQTYYDHTWIKNARSTWNGCVVDRGTSTAPSSANYDTNAVAPINNVAASQYAAQQFTSCPQAVMGLNYNWSAMTSLVNSLSPGGNTNQGIGLQAGWMSLSGGGPFTVPPMDSKYKYQQVIILLTDGLNTQNRWYTNTSSIDSRQATTCANAKAADITIYTIQVNTDGDPTSSLLQNCASSSDKFFLLTSSTQMVSVFNQIGTALSNLRVAK
jgi:Flp pilus assembly protein TadG